MVTSYNLSVYPSIIYLSIYQPNHLPTYHQLSVHSSTYPTYPINYLAPTLENPLFIQNYFYKSLSNLPLQIRIQKVFQPVGGLNFSLLSHLRESVQHFPSADPRCIPFRPLPSILAFMMNVNILSKLTFCTSSRS